jgi:Histidine kinase/Y_Y_Y domain
VSISYIDNGKIVINTRNGINFYDPQKNTFSERIFPDFTFTSAYEDQERNLWLTTSGSGVLMVPSFQLRNYSFRDDKKNSEISALMLSGDDLYAGGWGKLWKAQVDSLKFTSQKLSFRDGKIISILRVNNTLAVGHNKYSENPFNHLKYNLGLKSAQIGKSGVLLATHAMALLCKWNGETELIWDGRTTCAVEKDSGFYIGTLAGLFFKSFSGQSIDLGNRFPVFKSRIVNVAVSNDNTLWVTTKGNGIAAYRDGKLLCHVTQTEGLTSDNCMSLFLDGNIVWLGTNKGVNRIDISGQTLNIIRFSISDGLPSDNINAVVASGNKVFVGTPKGLTYFDVSKISQTSSCDLQLTGVYVANKYWSYDSTNFSLPHKSNDIRFEFSGISFKSAGELTYKYRLLGLQPEWRTTTENQLSFPSLSSGKYTLQLMATNKYGVKSKTKEISFEIEKLLWEKTWFRIAVALFVAAGVWFYFSFRVKSIRGKEKEKTAINKRIAELEQKALRSQMNPHFIFNCLNSIQQYVAERDITGANKFITDFSRLIRMTLDLSTHPFISLYDEVEYISTYLRVEKARLEDAFQYHLNIDESLNLHAVYIPPLLLQPYLENSIRHGIRYKTEGDGLIQISISKKDSGVLIQIQDNGIGRQASKKYKSEYHIQYQSRGMTINEDRIKMLNITAEKSIELTVTDLYNSKEEAEGTRVDLYLRS